MSNLEFSVTVNGREYSVVIDDGGRPVHQGTLRITDSELGIDVTDSCGECNPLLSFWNGPDSLLTGAARTSKINSILKSTVESSLQELAEFRSQLIECEDEVPTEVNSVLAAAGL